KVGGERQAAANPASTRLSGFGGRLTRLLNQATTEETKKNDASAPAADKNSQPIANAEVYFFDNLNQPKSKRMVRTGADGRFSFVSTIDSGEVALAVLAKGFAP